MAYKIGYYIGFCIGFIKNLINERREKRNPKPPVELHPCPFCGSEPFYRESDILGYKIGCDNPDCPIKPEVGWGFYLELIERAWNIRAEIHEKSTK